MVSVGALVDVAIATVPVLLGWIARVVRRIDRRTERVELHDRTLFGEDEVDADRGLVERVHEIESAVQSRTRTDGGRSGDE